MWVAAIMKIAAVISNRINSSDSSIPKGLPPPMS
jgi:hypothetical protein